MDAESSLVASPLALRSVAPTLPARFSRVREIGRGAQGVVYEAVDDAIGTRVALKVLAPAVANDPAVVERMRREALLTRRVVHPGVCRIHDFVVSDTATFLVMELVDGQSLAALLAAGPLDPAEARRIVVDAGRAVAATHAAGVIHRDLKPQNLLVAENGRVVVVDFGVATAHDLPRLTQMDAIVGTRAFVAPEIWLGAPATALADLYALGVILYEALTGTSPYGDVAGGEVTAAVAPSERQPRLSRQMDSVVLRAMAPQPRDRFQTMRAFVDALEGASLFAVDADDAAKQSRRSRKAVALLALLALPVLGAGGFAVGRAFRRSEPAVEVLPLPATPSPSPSPPLSPSPTATPESATPTATEPELPAPSKLASSPRSASLAKRRKAATTHVLRLRKERAVLARDLPAVDDAVARIRAGSSLDAVNAAAADAERMLAGFQPDAAFLDQKLRRFNTAYAGLSPTERPPLDVRMAKVSTLIAARRYAEANATLTNAFLALPRQ